MCVYLCVKEVYDVKYMNTHTHKELRKGSIKTPPKASHKSEIEYFHSE